VSVLSPLRNEINIVKEEEKINEPKTGETDFIYERDDEY